MICSIWMIDFCMGIIMNVLYNVVWMGIWARQASFCHNKIAVKLTADI